MTKQHAGHLTLVMALFAVIAGCGGAHVHKGEKFELDSQFRKQFDASTDVSCESAKRALLSQGYTLDDNFPDSIKAHKEFQPEDETMTVLEFSVVCMPNVRGTMLYANAVESIYQLKKTSESVGVGVSSVGSIKLPWGKQVDSLVKTSGATIDHKKFYKRFFNLVEELIKETKRSGYR